MASDVYQMDYELLEQAASQYANTAQLMEDFQTRSKQFAKLMREECMKSKAGEAFAEIMEQDFPRDLGLFRDKLEQISGDLKGAVERTRDGVAAASTRFQR
ncbi:MAG: WXG100 family type VII secretion target [Anaerolineales bacterium]|nr:WXG100 family type VII secretion target [Anaerolineales bacterium]